MMAGAMSKANQRQAQKSKSGKRYGLRRVRMSEIPMVCKTCRQTVTLPSVQAYAEGGNVCRHCNVGKLTFDTAKFKPQVVKR